MFIITVSETNAIAAMGSEIAYQSNGYPVIVEKNIAFVPEHFRVHEVDAVPEEIVEYKYCYTKETGFYENPDYTEPNPYGIPDELVEQIKNDAITEVEQEVTNGTDE